MENHKDDTTYYLRSKKRKIENGEEATCSHCCENTFRRKNPIMHVPVEILQSNKVRKVNRKFKLAAEDLLNRTFRGLSKKLENLTATTLSAIESTQDDMEIKCLCRLLNQLEIINFQQSVIMATIWRYVYNEFYKTQRTCMYAGLILDLYDIFLLKFIRKPYQIYGPAVVKDYALPEEVKHIIYLTKTFCIHFDKVSEETAKDALSIAGCKMIDLLDCASFATRSVIFEKNTDTTFSAKYSYYLRNAWFVAFGIPPEKQMTMKQKQRMMHMRVRRIILAHTEMFLQQHQYERELLVRTNPAIKRPSVIVYTGFGDVQDTFFIYGAMNEAAYLQKYHLQEDIDDEDEFQDAAEMLPNPEEAEEQENFIPHLGLQIDIRVDCPLAYAPYKYITANEQMIRREEGTRNGMFNLCFEFNFPGAQYLRLPCICNYYKRISTRH